LKLGVHVKSSAATLVYSCILSSIFIAANGGAMEKRNVGVRIGPSYSQIDLSPYGEFQWGTGLAIGPFLSTAISEGASIDLSAIYTVRSGDYRDVTLEEDESVVEVGRATLSLDYVDLSILLRQAVFRQPTFSPVLIGGLSYGIVTSTEFVQDGYLYPDLGNHADAAVVAGLGVERILDGPNLSVDLVYRHPIAESGWGSPEVRGFSLLFGLGF
jgi:hypothetical protein